MFPGYIFHWRGKPALQPSGEICKLKREKRKEVKKSRKEMTMSPRGIRDIKGARAVRGVGSLNIKSGQSTESKKDAKLFQLDIEKDSLMKVLEQFEHQKAQIEKRLSEIAQATQREVPQLEELL